MKTAPLSVLHWIESDFRSLIKEKTILVTACNVFVSGVRDGYGERRAIGVTVLSTSLGIAVSAPEDVRQWLATELQAAIQDEKVLDEALAMLAVGVREAHDHQRAMMATIVCTVCDVAGVDYRAAGHGHSAN